MSDWLRRVFHENIKPYLIVVLLILHLTVLFIFGILQMPEDWYSSWIAYPRIWGILTFIRVDMLNNNSWRLIFSTLLILYPVPIAFNYWELFSLKSDNKKLKNENDSLLSQNKSIQLETYSIFSGYLKCISDSFALSPKERVSIYKLNEDLFICVGRYSESEEYSRKSQKPYPKSKGCIGKAWDLGAHEVTNCPEYDTDKKKWIKFHKSNYRYSDADLKGIRMKSASFLGIRLKDVSGSTTAVIVFESIIAGTGLKQFKSGFNDNFAASLVHLLQALEEHIPLPESAKKEGF